MATGFSSFDDDVKAGQVSPNVGAAVPIELPPELQRHGVLWPNPADQVSDHSAEGAPWVPAAGTINQPTEPPMGPMPMGHHDADSVPFDAQAAVDPVSGDQIAAPATANHAGLDGSYWDPGDDGPGLNTPPNSWAQINIGKPFTVNQGSSEHRNLLSSTSYDAATGRRVMIPDAPSAPHEIYGSQHNTRPRQIPSEVGPLFDWAWPAGPQFSDDPGYWGVMAGMPDMSQRPHGSVAAQMPDDPYVANATGQPAPAAAAVPEAIWEF
jgi:hypothetical protein